MTQIYWNTPKMNKGLIPWDGGSITTTQKADRLFLIELKDSNLYF